MPVVMGDAVRLMEQEEFGSVAYGVMEKAFAIHNEWGRFFDEKVYQRELAFQLGAAARTGVAVKAVHGDFCKTYFLDLLVDGGALFELKAVERLTDRHRSQLLNYLLLSGLRHGKLATFPPERIEHEFVNTSLTHAERTSFVVRDDTWNESVAQGGELKRLIVDLLQDWGTNLDLHLYEEAITHHFGGPDVVHREIDVCHEGRRLGTQTVRLIDPQTTFKISSLPNSLDDFERHVRRFLNHTALQHIHWINITLHKITFKTLPK